MSQKIPQSTSLQCLDVGYAKNSGYGRYVRSVYVIHYCIRGCGFLECDDKVFRITAGQSFLIKANMEVAYRPDPADPWEYRWIVFVGDEAKTLLKQSALWQEYVSPPFGEELHTLFEQVYTTWDCFSPAGIARGKVYFYQILGFYMEHFPSPVVSPFETVAERAISYIENHYFDDTLSVDHVANVLGIDRITLYRHFKQAIGISPSAFITRLRLSRACDLLAIKHASVKLAALSVGFSDPLYFSRLFKQHYGMPPSKYHKRATHKKTV